MFFKELLTIALLLIVPAILSSCNNIEMKTERIVCGIKVKDCHYDIGSVGSSYNSPHFRHFCYVLQNTTNREIYLDTLEVSCNCLSVNYVPKCIKAYSSDSIVGNIDVTDLRGHFSRSIYVNFECGDIMLLRVTGVIDISKNE